MLYEVITGAATSSGSDTGNRRPGTEKARNRLAGASTGETLALMLSPVPRRADRRGTRRTGPPGAQDWRDLAYRNNFV